MEAGAQSKIFMRVAGGTPVAVVAPFIGHVAAAYRVAQIPGAGTARIRSLVHLTSLSWGAAAFLQAPRVRRYRRRVHGLPWATSVPLREWTHGRSIRAGTDLRGLELPEEARMQVRPGACRRRCSGVGCRSTVGQSIFLSKINGQA